MMQIILRYLSSMLPYMLAALPVATLWRAGLYFRRRRLGQATTLPHELLSVLVVLVAVVILSQTVLVQLASGRLQGEKRINLIPFTILAVCIRAKSFAFTLINIAGNIAVFAPLGLLLPLTWRAFERAGRTVAACALFSLLIELAQYPLHRGTDIDDLILNTLGGVIGYLLFWLIKKLSPCFTEKCKVKNSKI